MKKINLMILPLLSIVTITSCNNNKDRKEYEVISKDNIQYLLYNGVDKIASVVGYNYGVADEITLPSKVNGYPVTAIAKEAFEYSGISKITIPDSIEYIGSAAFFGCSNLKDITLPNSIETLPSNIFANCSSLTNITLPNNLSYIDDGAFLGCYSLTNIAIPDSLFGLGSYVFGGCESLVNIDFSKTRLYNIGSYCFYNCNKLSNINLSNNLAVIAEKAFSYCSSLEKIYIPEFDKKYEYPYLGEDLFNNCNSNLKILFGGNLPTYYSYTFSSGHPFAIGTNKDRALNDVFVKDDQNIQYSINNLDKTEAPKTAFLHYLDSDEDTIIVPATISNGTVTADVTEIMPNAFSSKESLKTVDLKDLSQLSYIGAYAFCYDTELDTITLPSTETSTYLDIGAFYKCRKLTKINNLNQIKDLELRGYTFLECFKLGNLESDPFIFSNKIKSITSTDFKSWGAVDNQYIKIESSGYTEKEGIVTLNAKGDNDETITLKNESSNKYSNSKYFGKAIITLGE